MNKTSKIIGAALGRVFGGLALSFILCVATSVIAMEEECSRQHPGRWTLA
jgi:hypothetical protein